MSRIDDVFAGLRAAQRPGLVTYVTAGDPDLERSAGILRALDRAGVDVLEVGVPFSDPLADGPVIQRATERALAAGGSLAATLDMVKGVRAGLRAPIVLFSYANPLMRMGVDRFAARAAAAGVDGVLVLESADRRGRRLSRHDGRRGPRYHLPPQSDDHAGTDQAGGPPRPRLPVRHFAARRDRRARHGGGRRG